MAAMLYDDPLHDEASDDDQADFAAAVYAAAAGRREREAGPGSLPLIACAHPGTRVPAC
jgi:hypothetical protein